MNDTLTPTHANKYKIPLMVVYLLAMAAAIAYVVYFYGITFDDRSEEELVTGAYYFAPALIFSIIGLITNKTAKSVLYALCGAVAAAVLLVVFFQGIWPML